MSSARFIVGDSLAVTRTLRDQCIDFLMCSPPFLALRNYLPADHPDKALEIGSEATPAAFIDVLLDLSAEWRRVLAPHGSICVELGDTYCGAGGYGDPDSPNPAYGKGERFEERWEGRTRKRYKTKNDGWPRAKSLTLIPEAYRFALVYGINPHTGQPSPAGQWQVRNVIRRCSPNPPVGALGKKWRPATSELVIATPDDDRRYWDDVATRTAFSEATIRSDGYSRDSDKFNNRSEARTGTYDPNVRTNAMTHAGAPLLDWWKITPTGYPGAHYAVYPPELCEAPIEAMCPRRVCRTCGEPSRRETEKSDEYAAIRARVGDMYTHKTGVNDRASGQHGDNRAAQLGKLTAAEYETTGWTSCGCPGTDGIQLDGYHTGSGWRPGVVFDPFAGTGTTLAVATGHGRDAIGIDLDPRNAHLALERVGPLLLTVEHHAEPVEYTPTEVHNSTGNPRFRVGYVNHPGRRPEHRNYGEPA